MSTETTPQKWTERLAADLALVDRLPDEAQACACILPNVGVCVWDSSVSKLIDAFVNEFAPDSEIVRKDATQYGLRDSTVTFADGARLTWQRKVRVTVVEVDEE